MNLDLMKSITIGFKNPFESNWTKSLWVEEYGIINGIFVKFRPYIAIKNAPKMSPMNS